MMTSQSTSLMIMVIGLLILTLGTSPVVAGDLQDWGDKIDNVSKRFKVLNDFNDEAVLDKETQLVWERSPGETDGIPGVDKDDRQSWFEARLTCLNREIAGRKGWRLPSIPEVVSLVDPNESFPALPLNNPFQNIQSSEGYVSATTNAQNDSTNWTVSLVRGEVFAVSKEARGFVWCVRGGMNADAY